METRSFTSRPFIQFGLAVVSIMLVCQAGFCVTMEELVERLEKLEAENRVLKDKVARLEGKEATVPTAVPVKPDGTPRQFINCDHELTYEMLDSTTRINRKQLLLLEKRQSGELADDSVVVGAAVTAIADVQKSNTESKFGYLMRHPTSANQRTKDVSEALIHSAQISLAGSLGSWITAYMEVLYDPEQSFGSGAITDLNRNQLQLRRGYVLFGNLDESPLYLSLGKMATPFGLTDTVNPFTASTVWHAFGGLAYGVQGGYYKGGLSLAVMGVQGGAQFRAHNMPVDDTNIPSKLNNYVVDANYTFSFGDGDSLVLGASYQEGSAYCQKFPVTHFVSCDDNNPAYDVYAQLTLGDFQFQAEFAETVDEWPGTFNPHIPEFEAHEVSSLGLGAKYRMEWFEKDVDLSLEFSRFTAGPDGAEWEDQDQWVLGLATFVTPSVKLFAEYIHTEGYVPLNFISGGNVEQGETHSDRNAKSDILMLGVNAAF